MSDHKPLIVVDSYIPFLQGLLEPYFSVSVLQLADITPEAVRHAHALLVRTRTRCDAALLAGSSVRFVGTATIGYDHIDRTWCADNGIVTTNAPGCNAPAVAQYVFAAIARLINRPVDQYTIGIVGVGHVGGIVEQWARSLGMKVMRCDPPRQQAEGGSDWFTLDQVAEQADIVTFHTPLTRTGDCPSFHLADADFFARLRRAPIIINAARGPVVDTDALIAAINAGTVGPVAIDTWEGEPAIRTDLMDLVDIATPHIAGYSRDGKIRATRMVLDRLADTFALPHIEMTTEQAAPIPSAVRLTRVADSYDIMADDAILRSAPADFERLRDNYHLRPECRSPRPD